MKVLLKRFHLDGHSIHMMLLSVFHYITYKGAYIAGVGSVFLRFRSKERGTRVKDRTEMGRVKERGGVVRGAKTKNPGRSTSFLESVLLRNQAATLATQIVLIKSSIAFYLRVHYSHNSNSLTCFCNGVPEHAL